MRSGVRRAAAVGLCLGCLLRPAGGRADGPARIQPSQLADPLWEAGLLAGAVSLPAYRGSDEYRTYAVPVPYAIYRGEILRFDDESVEGLFFTSGPLEVDASLYLDVNDNDDARRGMPELHPLIFEAGPALRFHFLPRTDHRQKLFAELPLRAAISADWDDGLSLRYRGFQGKINLLYEKNWRFRARTCTFVGAIGAAFADADLCGYYYDVPEADANAGRPRFEAGGGYAGSSAAASLRMPLSRRLAVRLYGRCESLAGTVFEDSPLVSQPYAVGGGVAVFVRLGESIERASGR